MTRSDAHKVAEELLPMLLKEIRKMMPKMAEKEFDEFLTTEQAADMICRSVSFMKKHPEIPYTKVGSRRLYSRIELEKWARR